MNTVTADSVLGMARNFMESRILLSGAELNLFGLLAATPLSAAEAAQRTGTHVRGLTILLDALTAIHLLDKKEGQYACPANVAALLSPDSPDTVLPMVLHAWGLWKRWDKLTEIVRHGGSDRAPGAFEEEGQLEAFIGAMHVIGRKGAKVFVEAAKPGAAKALLDVGGATGTYAQAFLDACPDMRATIFDQPQVIEMARKRLGAEGVLDRIALVAGDFYKDELPGGHDLVLLSAIIHQNSPEENVALYKNALRSLVPGGRILIRDHVLSPDRTQPPGGAMFAVNMLVATPGGNSYTLAEIRETLEAAGFVQVALIQPDERMNGLVEAFKP